MRYIRGIFSSFANKIIISTVVFFLATLAVIFSYTTQILQNSIKEEYQNYAHNIELFLNNALPPLLITQDLNAIEAVMDPISELEVIHKLNVYSYDEIIFSVDKHSSEYESLDISDQAFHQGAMLIHVAEELIGRVEYTLFLGERLQTVASQKKQLFLSAVLAAMLFIVLIVFFLSAITRKIKLLGIASKQITQNHLPEFLPTDGNDEISRTTEAFNQMLWQLREKYVALDLSPDGIMIISVTGSVKYCNSALTRILGQDVVSFQGKSLSDIDEIFRNRLNKPESEITSLTNDFHEAQLVFGGEPKIIVRCHKERYSSIQGSEFSTLYYFLDVTHETEVERLKSDFLNTAAHELRTPLSSILGFSELLLNLDFDKDRVREFCGYIHRQSLLLQSIINELLDIARIEARSPIFLELADDDLSELLTECCQQAPYLFPDKVVEISTSYPSGIIANIDRDKLRRAILNLLSNAIKYSEQNASIELTYTAPGPTEPWHILTIRDHGIGMSRNQLARLGEKFYRVEDSGKVPGTGLGVSISMRLVELHGGA